MLVEADIITLLGWLVTAYAFGWSGGMFIMFFRRLGESL